MSSEIPTRIKQLARDAGFELCGIAPVREFAELQVFPNWIAAGRQGEMKYMEACDEAGNLKRAALQRVAPWARSVIVCAINYNTAQPYSLENEDLSRGWISRYAWSREDYHDCVMRKLHVVESGLHELLNEAADPRTTSGTTLQTRAYVDTGPLIERAFAKYAGVGWTGKNTCIINQKMGSWLFLGVILASIECATDIPAPDRCGTCTRCITACPTRAIIAPGELDARLCISYLTIEKRGEIPENLREGMGRHIFGCDICQDVCPWNRKSPATNAEEFQAREGFVNPELEWIAKMPVEEFRVVFRRSPVRRTKLSGLRRNAVIAMGNSGNSKFIPTLKRLSADPDPMVAEHAKWALERMQSGKSV